MATGNWYDTDLYRIFGMLQTSMIVFPKELVIAGLRDFFAKDSFYHYVADEWGYPKTIDHTDLPLGAGMADEVTTRIFIGEAFRQDIKFYPSVIVKNGGMRYVPISINRERGSYVSENRVYEDGYGNTKTVRVPKAFRFEGVSEGSIVIDITTRSMRTRDDLAELIYMFFVDIRSDDFKNAGLVVKGVNISSPSENDDRNNKLYKVSITLDIRTEWKREVPIDSYIERILFNVSIGNIDTAAPISPNLTVQTSVSYLDLLLNSGESITNK